MRISLSLIVVASGPWAFGGVLGYFTVLELVSFSAMPSPTATPPSCPPYPTSVVAILHYISLASIVGCSSLTLLPVWVARRVGGDVGDATVHFLDAGFALVGGSVFWAVLLVVSLRRVCSSTILQLSFLLFLPA